MIEDSIQPLRDQAKAQPGRHRTRRQLPHSEQACSTLEHLSLDCSGDPSRICSLYLEFGTTSPGFIAAAPQFRPLVAFEAGERTTHVATSATRAETILG
jgi:hypothetical protein